MYLNTRCRTENEMNLSVNWQKDFQFEVITDKNMRIFVDADSEAALCPTEVLLSALGSCSATDVLSGLQEQNCKINCFKNELSYTLTDDSPRLYKSVNLHFAIEGTDVSEKQVLAMAHAAVNKYCHVCLMLKPAIEITYSTEVKLI